MAVVSVTTMNPSDAHMGTWTQWLISILMPMNTRTADNPSWRYWNRDIIFASRKYNARRPRIAKAFDVKTRKALRVTPKIAGIESTANTMSVVSTTTSTANSG